MAEILLIISRYIPGIHCHPPRCFPALRSDRVEPEKFLDHSKLIDYIYPFYTPNEAVVLGTTLLIFPYTSMVGSKHGV